MGCYRKGLIYFGLTLFVSGVLTKDLNANILMTLHEPGTSHFHDATIIAAVLKNRGHNITFLIPGPVETNYKYVAKHVDKFNFIYLQTPCIEKVYVEDIVKLAQDAQINWGSLFLEKIKLPAKMMKGYIDGSRQGMGGQHCDIDVADLLSPAEFDLVILEGSFLWLHGHAQRLALPYVLLTTCAASSLTNSWNHAPNLPAILPGFMVKVHHREPMSFLWRVYNAVNILGSAVFFSVFADNIMLSTASDYISEIVIPPTRSFGLSDVWLTNADYTTDAPRPFLPNTALVGGLSIEQPKSLDKEFQTIVEGANEHGLLIVSMGTVVQGIGQKQIDEMAAAFARLPQIVVWKEPSPLPRFVGNNTILKRWLPQKDLLAHPNTLAMVYHCGNNGAFEALYHGIPIIAIPVFGDQTDVAYRVMSNGMGLVVEIPTLTNETLYQTVSEVINNKRYKHRAAHLSDVYRDMAYPSSERAAYWIEYVLRHGGNRLMRAKVAHMGIIQEYMLDVCAVCITISVLAIFTAKKIIVRCLRRI